jgi:hypothetical protein
MSEDDDKAAAMLANALLSYYSGIKWAAGDDAAERVERQPDAIGRTMWTKARDLLRSPNPIPNYRGHFPDIPNPNAVHYVRIKTYADGGAVSHGGDDDDDDDEKKISKAQAHYRLGTKHRRCGLCSMYVKGKTVHDDGTCTLVEGSISPQGTCCYFERKK